VAVRDDVAEEVADQPARVRLVRRDVLERPLLPVEQVEAVGVDAARAFACYETCYGISKPFRAGFGPESFAIGAPNALACFVVRVVSFVVRG
jgi:hypothetical protein